MRRLIPLALALVAATPTEVARRDGANLQAPRWSSGGVKLSYEANFHEKQVVETWVGDPTARQFTQVHASARSPSALTSGFQTSNQAGAVVHEVAWAPTGDRYVFSASTDAGDYDLFLSGAGPLSPGAGADGGPAWSPDGRWIAFTSARTGEGDLYAIDVQAVEQAPRRLSSAAESSELYAAWSPDSKALAYVGHSRTGDNLWVKPAIDQNPFQLTAWTGNQVRPRFSPDGKIVAFYANHTRPDRFDLYVVEPIASVVPRLLVEGVVPDAAGPAFTPDGARIVFVKDDDEAFDPLQTVALADRAVATVPVDTVGNGDLDVVQRADGKVWVAWVAQGRKGDADRTFRRLYIAPLD